MEAFHGLHGPYERCNRAIWWPDYQPGGNLRSIVSGPESGVKFLNRWRSAMWSGYTYITIGLFCCAVVVIISAAPAEVFATLAGLALIGTFAG